MKLDDLDPAEIALRLGLAALAGVGVVAAMYASLVSALAPPIPYKFLPDLRPVVLFGVTFAIGAFAAWGPGRRRGFLIAFLLAVHGVFAFELSTIHWFIPYPGPIGASRAEPIRLLAALTGLAAALLLQARAHADATRAEMAGRGVPAGEAAGVAALLRARATRAILLAGAGAGALALVVEATAIATGDEGALSTPAAIGLGVVALLVAGVAVGLLARRAPPTVEGGA